MFDLDRSFDVNAEIRNLFENLKYSFKFSLEINPYLENEISKVYVRTLNNYARFIIGEFQLTLFKRSEQLIRLGDNEDSINLIRRFTDYMGYFFDEVFLKIRIESMEDLEQLKYILTLSLLLINDALEENNPGLAFESFYQLESRIKRHFSLNQKFIYDSKSPYFIQYDEVKNDNIVIIEAEEYVL